MTARYETLTRWALEKEWTSGAELGVFDGITFFYLLRHCSRLKILGVDVWDPSHQEGPTKSGEKCRCIHCEDTRRRRRMFSGPATMRAAVELQVASFPNGRLFVGKTSAAVRTVDDDSLDFVFIDADHSVEGVFEDILNWVPKIKPGGFLVGHDWNMDSVKIGVMQAFGEMGWQQALQFEDDHVWWVEC